MLQHARGVALQQASSGPGPDGSIRASIRFRGSLPRSRGSGHARASIFFPDELEGGPRAVQRPGVVEALVSGPWRVGRTAGGPGCPARSSRPGAAPVSGIRARREAPRSRPAPDAPASRAPPRGRTRRARAGLRLMPLWSGCLRALTSLQSTPPRPLERATRASDSRHRCGRGRPCSDRSPGRASRSRRWPGDGAPGSGSFRSPCRTGFSWRPVAVELPIGERDVVGTGVAINACVGASASNLGVRRAETSTPVRHLHGRLGMGVPTAAESRLTTGELAPGRRG